MAKMINCKTCSQEIASSAKTCPGCGAKNKKPIYKRPWFIVIAFFIIVGAIGGAGDDNSTTTDSKTTGIEQEVNQNQITKEDVQVEKDVPTEYKSALKQAQSYSKIMHMSKAGIFDQLTSEYGGKFTEEAAQYAIDNMEADWNANALASAKSYQDTMAMSPSAIFDQLISEYGGKFTEEEAQYAIDNLE